MRHRPLRDRPWGNLPSEPGRFIGRGAELAELGRLLESSRLVTVTGVGGVGKSRPALAAADVPGAGRRAVGGRAVRGLRGREGGN
ncbi:hypothetical protein [Streptomyces sp. NRRL F-2580]|uniref:hypothetical protein n=1 Tax=Streptomyces sp. NRRL F-2580 TaxID=1463841 RepID=UPI00099D005D|nr:hypothetical protein [Streptomyces sp. NRRL F-2580]